MNGNNVRALRDALLTGGPAGFVTAYLAQHGFSSAEAAMVGMFIGGVVARAWRLARTRWPVLEQLLGAGGATYP